MSDVSGRVHEASLQPRNPTNNGLTSLECLMEIGASLKRKYESKGWGFVAVEFGFGGLVHRSTQQTVSFLHENGWKDIDAAEVFDRNSVFPYILKTTLSCQPWQRRVSVRAGVQEALVRQGSSCKMIVGTYNSVDLLRLAGWASRIHSSEKRISSDFLSNRWSKRLSIPSS